ncbi:uncharacterized protein DNG_01140 [Cephalotrichum gorgonifer]|uniref:DUF4048 domain-containing protein n=1 Tax=Cephalotrichum gorgonifer TaxID=2041049 RepID=A0AAE8MQV4_9PEZI|nr:uncharacterized protein DNG_01140 [Cephalotrichum gorgonifer]
MTIFSRVCTTAFLHDQKNLIKTHKALVAARKTSHSFATWRHRLRRTRSPPSTLFATIRRRRSRPFAADCRSLQQLSEEQLELYSRTGSLENMVTERPPSAGRGHRDPLRDNNVHNEGWGIGSEAMKTTNRMGKQRDNGSTTAMPNDPSTNNSPSSIDARAEEMAPPPTPAENLVRTRSTRSTSSASRNTNRLSITLPIALPTSDPSRPVPSSASSTLGPSLPGTPARQLPSTPADANEMIIAIAAQERRVMELREELSRAESDLKRVKREWTMHEAYRKSNDRNLSEQHRQARPTTAMQPQPEVWPSTPRDDDLAVKRSVELDRRRLLLLQTQNQATPKDERKRVFQGRHTRTLSLLSPTKSEDNPFSAHEDRGVPASSLAAASDSLDRPTPVVRRQAALNKRATWQPQGGSSHGHSSSMSMSMNAQAMANGGNPMSQIVEDFKLGFKTFYEDIRQITVGDEPLGSAVPGRPTAAGDLATRRGSKSSYADDQETIRPSSHVARPKLEAAFEYPDTETPSKTTKSRPGDSSVAAAGQRERNARTRNKHFSWTPLSFENIDGDAWLTFDSPASTGKSTRWSGSTMNEEEEEERKTQEVESPLAKKVAAASPVAGPLSPQRLEEFTATVVSSLSPSNLKRTASEYVTQWEQSLAMSATEAREQQPAKGRAGDDKPEAVAQGMENASLLV